MHFSVSDFAIQWELFAALGETRITSSGGGALTTFVYGDVHAIFLDLKSSL